jgi:hypothetical protein
MSKTKAKPVDRAMPTIRKPKSSDVTKVATTRSTTTAMKGSSLWGGSPELQAANTAWNSAADSLESNAKAISNLRSQLATLEASQRTLRVGWTAATKRMMGIATVVCQGSADNVHALGLDVFAHVPIGALATPTGLTGKPGSLPGQALLAWHRGVAKHGFLVQHATDVANQATWSVLIASTRAKYTFDGGQPQSTLHFRVASIDPTSSTGTSPWTDWVAVTLR